VKETAIMKSSSNRLLRIAALLAVAIAVAACTTTQSVSRQIDDNEIHAAVKSRLTTARFSNIVNIDINVTNGIVTLAGEVPNAAVKADAGHEAHAVKGVVRVHNELQVKVPAAS
jgi:osmotically-inducible protein OsmY